MSKIKSIKLLLICSKSFSHYRVHALGEYFVVVLTLVFFGTHTHFLEETTAPLPIFS